MKRSQSTALIGILALTVGLLILKVTFSVVLGYRDYFPPNFNADFLRGRETYFFGAYQWAFYAHIASGPITLILGLFLVSERFRLRFPAGIECSGRLRSQSLRCSQPQRLVACTLCSDRADRCGRICPAGNCHGTVCPARLAVRHEAPLRGTSPLDVATVSLALVSSDRATRRRICDGVRRWCSLDLSVYRLGELARAVNGLRVGRNRETIVQATCTIGQTYLSTPAAT